MSKLWRATALALVAVLLFSSAVLAYLYRAPLAIIESAGTSYSMFPAIVDSGNLWMSNNGFMGTDAMDTRVQTLGGLNKPHMVVVDKTLTAVPVPANSQTNLYFATGETNLTSMDIIAGHDGYVIISDSPTLELGSDFVVEQNGYVDTSYAANKYLIHKPFAFATYIQADNTIRSAILATSSGAYISPTNFIDGGGTWSTETLIYDDLTATKGQDDNIAGGAWGNFIQLTYVNGLYAESIRYYATCGGVGAIDWIDVDVYYGSAWQDVYQGAFANLAWESQALGDTYWVTNARVRFHNDSGGLLDGELWEFDFRQTDEAESLAVTVDGVLSDEHGVMTVADGANLSIYVASSLYYEQSDDGGNVGELILGTDWWGQTFTPTISHTVDKVKLRLQRVLWPGTVVVQIQATTLGEPSGAVLCSGTINGNTLSTGWWWETITLDSSYNLVAGTMYAIVVGAPSGDAGNRVEWAHDPPAGPGGGPYSGGEAMYSGWSGVGGSWIQSPNPPVFIDEDFIFGEGSSVGGTGVIDPTDPFTYDYYDTAVLGGGVPDEDPDWIINQNNATPYQEYTKITVGGVEHAWYQPNYMVANTSFDGTADAGGDVDTIIDAALTQADDYWMGALVTITDTTDNLAPIGETSICTDFIAATDEVTIYPVLTAGIDVGDTYTIEFGTLIDRSHYGLSFDGADDQVVVTDAASIQDIFDGGGTISLWTNVASGGENAEGRIAGKTNWYVRVDSEAAGEVKVTFWHNFSITGGTWVTDDTVLTNGTWSNLVITYDDDAVTGDPIFYVDGVALTVGSGLTETSTPVGVRVTDAGFDLYIGDNSGSVRCFDGVMDEVWCYNRAITSAEVVANYNLGDGAYVPNSTTGLEVELHVEDGVGGVTTDTSGNGNDGAITNAVWVDGKVERTVGNGGTNDGRITWGVNPTGILVSLGSMVSSGQPNIGATVDTPSRDLLPEIGTSDWYVEPDVLGSLATNPFRPFVKAISDVTINPTTGLPSITELQMWRWMGLAFVFLITATAIRAVPHHLAVACAAAGVATVALVVLTIWPPYALVLLVLCIFGGWVSERSPTL